MSEELRQPPVVDLEALLQPISGEYPAGESLRYAGLYDQISDARRADDGLSQGEWQTEQKVADYRKVIDIATPALTTETKDLQIAVWLTEALMKQYGLPGLRDGLGFLNGLHDQYWETMHPVVEDGDMEGRANAISWLDTTGAIVVKEAQITGGAGYSYIDFEDSKTFDIPEALDTLSTEDQIKYNQLREQAEREQRVTADMWRKEKAATRRAWCETINFTIEECWTAFNELNRLIEEKYERNQAPGLSNLRKSLDAVHEQVKKLLEEKRQEEPDDEEVAAAESGDGTGETGVAGPGGVAAPAGAIQNRKDALRRLADIADFFQKTEPHSPVAYLIQRAVKWGHMPLENWLQDVIKDETILYQLRQTLGFNTTSSADQNQGGQSGT
ncbi:MAG TPA: type VI secretion system protein TssA [Pyrinomonadaceae bacterium]|nr:type VI secretion system protein TssA [Pyrinomonadaceae bacterium]